MIPLLRCAVVCLVLAVTELTFVRAGPSNSSMRLVWRYHNLDAGAQIAIDIYKSDMSAQLIQHQICTPVATSNQYIVDTDSFATNPINLVVQPEQSYSGQISLSGHTYSISSADHCYRVFNQESAFIECNLPIAIPIVQAFPVKDTTDCILAAHSNSTFTLARSPSRGFFDQAKDKNVKKRYTPIANKLGRRKSSPEPQYISPCNPSDMSGTQIVGDGNPHQNALDKQLSQPLACDASPSCSVGQQESISYTIGFSATANPLEWISGGFAVSETTTTGNSYTCGGGVGDTVCMWSNVAHTAYTARDWQVPYCSSQDITYGDDIIIKSPNNNNDGGGYYCVINTCRNQGDEYWDDSRA